MKSGSSSEILELYSTQEETDTRVVLYCLHAARTGYKTVVVHSPDSDVFVILMHFAATIGITVLFETGNGNKRSLLNITALAADLSPKKCNALLGLHAFTRCDSTSCFKGKGKLNPIKLIESNPRFEDTFVEVGEQWEVSADLKKGLEEFTCRMYSNRKNEPQT